MITARPTPTLFWPGRGFAGVVVLVAAGSLLLAVSAKIQVPFWPVPATLQSLAVLLIGVAYGSRLGTATVLVYLAQAMAGLPVLAGATAGPASFAGPTGGYLVGFALAACGVGWMAERGWDRTVPRAAATMALGHALLFIPGVLWLAALFGWPSAISFGLTPFLVPTLVKTALGAALVTLFRKRLSQR